MKKRVAFIFLAGIAIVGLSSCSTNIKRKIDPSENRVKIEDNGKPPECITVVVYASADFSTEDIRKDKYCLAKE